MIITEGLEDNFESLFDEVKKYSLLRGLRDLFGNKVLKETQKYDKEKKKKLLIIMK